MSVFSLGEAWEYAHGRYQNISMDFFIVCIMVVLYTSIGGVAYYYFSRRVR